MLVNVQVVLALALLGAVSAELSCEDCSMIGTTTSEWASSDGKFIHHLNIDKHLRNHYCFFYIYIP